MAKTLLDLAESLEKRAARLDEQASGVAVSVALAIVDNLTVVTPVDTSKAISNWQVTLGSPSAGEIPAHVEGFAGSTYTASGQAARNLARFDLQQKRPGVRIWISNAAPYIGELNNGSSKQEPAGFVERALIIGRNVVKNSKIKF